MIYLLREYGKTMYSPRQSFDTHVFFRKLFYRYKYPSFVIAPYNYFQIRILGARDDISLGAPALIMNIGM